MTEPKRLFDCLEFQIQNGGKPDMLAAKENGQWIKYSTADVIAIVEQLVAGLLEAGVSYNDGTTEGRDKIAILSKNQPQWLMLDLAVQKAGAVLTPFYPTLHINELEYVLNDAQVKFIFVNDENEYEKVSSIKARIPSLLEIFTFEKVEGARHWKELFRPVSETVKNKIQELSETIKSADLATIIYTSGTTGKPKGVMLSHNNILSNVLACVPCLPVSDLRVLSFLPLNHIFERLISYFYMYKGASIYYAESMEAIGDNLKEVSPNMFTTVPRLLEKVYDKIMKKGSDLTGIKKRMFFWAHDLASKFEINQNQGMWYNMQLAIANKLIFSKWREALGNNIICIVSGGAACQVRLIRIFTAAKIPIMEGYGLTETSPVISVNRFQETGRKFGTVGPVLDNVEVKIAEDGEILCKGPNIMMGYYRQPELTQEVITDNWFHTGDIGTIVDNRFLKITDRKKEMFKTSGGKYVAPLPIENKLKESMYIEQVMVLGADKKYVGALIVPSFPNLKDWAKQNGIEDRTNEGLIKNPKVKELFKDLLEGFNKYFNHVEQVKRFELVAAEWSIESGEMTPKLSLKRKIVMEKNAAAIDRIYPG
ncbi:MAG TPA: long-chain fatty acid--CoA ligase [Flavitalea sp.]|nr:long-chain fatty acid--CoA ligase [Flavitalea sp.]